MANPIWFPEVRIFIFTFLAIGSASLIGGLLPALSQERSTVLRCSAPWYG